MHFISSDRAHYVRLIVRFRWRLESAFYCGRSAEDLCRAGLPDKPLRQTSTTGSLTPHRCSWRPAGHHESTLMNASPRTPGWFLVTRHWLSLLGLALIITAGISLLFVATFETRGHAGNPYAGILLFIVIPAIFLAGLALVPIGVNLSKREIRGALITADFDRRSALRRLAWFAVITTVANVLIGTQLTYRSVKYMETPQFCGATCHAMKPEFTAYRNSPHSRVECVECHVAPGAAGWISSKASGIRQLVETVLGNQPTPIPSALQSNRLVPARETCENCHWPQRFSGAKLHVVSKFATDEANTRSETVLLMMVGGDRITGIHGAHVGAGIHIRFMADPARQSIPRVEVQNEATGHRRTFARPGEPEDLTKAMAKYEMQCVDCHNRPTHTFELPEPAMDRALALGEIPATLPFIKTLGVDLLKTSYPSSADAAWKLPEAVESFYRQSYPAIYATQSQAVDRAARAIQAIYARNVFPDLKVTWGTYPNHLGHTDSPGCFRCHDGAHATESGETITQDCNVCHQLLAIEEASSEILKKLGIAEQIAKIGGGGGRTNQDRKHDVHQVTDEGVLK